MYLDTAKPPKVTVGFGNMLPNVVAAQALRFVNTATNTPATKHEIESAFKTVAAMHGSLHNDKYKLHPSIEITKNDAKDLVMARLKKEYIPTLRRHLQGFDKYPLPARRALIDMIYNMGWASPAKDSHGKPLHVHGLVTFVPLIGAVEHGRWKEAAFHCHRKDSHPSQDKNKPSHAAKRNAWTKDLFEQIDRLVQPVDSGHVGHR